jgi:hypothetical protein
LPAPGHRAAIRLRMRSRGGCARTIRLVAGGTKCDSALHSRNADVDKHVYVGSDEDYFGFVADTSIKEIIRE